MCGNIAYEGYDKDNSRLEKNNASLQGLLRQTVKREKTHVEEVKKRKIC